MSDYHYRAVSHAGAMDIGMLEASSAEDALQQLRTRGLIPVSVTVRDIGSKKRRSNGAERRRGPPSHHEILSITSELAVMLRAGLPLDRALKVLVGMGPRQELKTMLDDLLTAVKGGKSLSQALRAYPSVFGHFYVNMVRSGEASGALAMVFERLAEHLERIKNLRDSVVAALIYPAILMVVACLSVSLMLGFVVPKFEQLFSDMGSALPLPTQIVVRAGNFMADYGWLIGLVIVIGGFLFRRWTKTSAGQEWLGKYLLRVPMLGEVVMKYELTRFSRTMGTLLANGVSILDALGIASETVGNQPLRASLGGLAAAIKQGGRLSVSLEKTGLFSQLAVNMVQIGEETGRLDTMLLELARVSDGEVQAGVRRVLTLLEPLLILVLGVVIAAIIISILMGILAVNDLAV